MTRYLLLCALLLLALTGCENRSNSQSEKGLREAFINFNNLYANHGDPEVIADLYVIPPNQTKEQNVAYAKSILKADLSIDYKIHGVNVLGSMGVVLLSATNSGSPSPLYARWENGGWKFFRSLVLWGNTNKLEHFGLSEEEMKNALKLQEWVTAERAKGEQDATFKPQE